MTRRHQRLGIHDCEPKCHVKPGKVHVNQAKPQVKFQCPVYHVTVKSECGEVIDKQTISSY